ncbi:MAG TPA: hypothetical protein VI704_02115 [Bacteroidota bacterium]|nr:hypothetical protein [Bacteroidota bacterium]
MKNLRWLANILAIVLAGCAASEIKPVDIFAEDACSQCKMAFSDQGFASEFISEDGSAHKFDDINCMEKFRKKNADVRVVRTFYKDFATKQWMPENKSIVVLTGIKTPMGSGKVAVSSSSIAKKLAEKYPPKNDLSENMSGCGSDCCSSKEK